MNSGGWGTAFLICSACALTLPAAAAGHAAAGHAAVTAQEPTKVADAGNDVVQGARIAEISASAGASRKATGGPKRLSALAGNDDAAWASAHSLRAILWRKPVRPVH